MKFPKFPFPLPDFPPDIFHQSDETMILCRVFWDETTTQSLFHLNFTSRIIFMSLRLTAFLWLYYFQRNQNFMDDGNRVIFHKGHSCQLPFLSVVSGQLVRYSFIIRVTVGMINKFDNNNFRKSRNLFENTLPALPLATNCWIR